jgi:hypothetical protein
MKNLIKNYYNKHNILTISLNLNKKFNYIINISEYIFNESVSDIKKDILVFEVMYYIYICIGFDRVHEKI